MFGKQICFYSIFFVVVIDGDKSCHPAHYLGQFTQITLIKLKAGNHMGQCLDCWCIQITIKDNENLSSSLISFKNDKKKTKL